MSTFIIAEAGSNHNRDFNQALALIDVAKQSGSDAVKFQTFTSEGVYSKHTPDYAGYKNLIELVKKTELPREWQKDLKQYCDEHNIEFMSTPFDEEAVEQLVSIGVKRLKIAGFESTDYRFVDMVCSTKLPIILSIGIGFDIKNLDKIFNITSKYNNHLTLLHCNNAYPTPMKDIHLGKMDLLAKYLGNQVQAVGLSDHTTTTLTPALAVAKGASVIEKHFTLSNLLSGPDHNFAMEPHQLKEMVDYIRLAEQSIQPWSSLLTNSEKDFSKGRRSIVAKTNIKVGDILTKNNITTKRPYLKSNIPASEYENILGSIAKYNYDKDDFIKQ